MDTITKEFIKLLMTRQQELSEQNLATMKLLVSSQNSAALTWRYVSEAIVLISRIDDEAGRRASLDSLWSQLSNDETQSQIAALTARVETSHEHLEAQIQSALRKLESHDGEDIF